MRKQITAVADYNTHLTLPLLHLAIYCAQFDDGCKKLVIA